MSQSPISGLESPLLGKRILVTRPRAQAAELCDQLGALGAQPVLFPTIEIAPMDDYTALDNAIRALSHYHWVIFTSVNGVATFWERLDLVGAGFIPAQLAAIGPATARALEGRGVRPNLIPDEYVAEAILDKIGEVSGRWILMPRADIAREALASELSRRGAVVHEIAAYRTLPAAPDPHGLAELRRGVDAITFTSSSTVRNFVRLVSGGDKYVDAANIRRTGRDGVPMPSLNRAAIACIGPVTAQTAREAGLPVDVMAREYTMDGLVAALAAYFSQPEYQLKENRWIPARSL
ncbi:MAG TPA: uroporphyrinogen-III synthase [Anaerolineales bacterium]|nr:uroporphyrinogen-III synthase [Anaerolineales bacterium]